MKPLLYRVLSILLVSISSIGLAYPQAPTEKSTFLVKADAFGIVASFPSSRYLKVSPELEWMPKAWSSVSTTLDLEYYHGDLDAASIRLATLYQEHEFYHGHDKRNEYSLRLGLRKYLHRNQTGAQGFFGELQLGISWNKRDTVYGLSNQYGAYISKHIYPEGRLRFGCQNKLSNRIWYTFSIEGDVRRAITEKAWYRIIVPELNIGFRF
jgi:hypothetical protein